MRRIEREACRQFYDKEKPYVKVCFHVCHQDQKADWDDLNKRYNDLVSQCKQRELELSKLPMPDHVYV